ncbi:MAG: ribosome biogenesis GTPase Der [Caldiserica bacterium]|jgi:GTP-binding protein|nr:ribosome biogenesis GTPase Der [Caldisericota bacterium]MDH7562858.1 ribosome biogenesis GTPase Der [Caldisericota bacterium]
MLPKVLIVGRPNVGKSALFNRIIRSRKSIVHQEPGVTRDLLQAEVEWNGRKFLLIDSGGLDLDSSDVIKAKAQEILLGMMKEVELILFVLDSREGVHPLDMEVSQMVREAGKPVILVANKIDSYSKMNEALSFFSLGWGDPIPVSGLNGFNIGELLDEISRRIPQVSSPERELLGKVAIVGRPNVGKSALLNSLLGKERVIVSEIPGTTRDAIDTYWESTEGNFLLIDTAGIKKKSKISTDLEFLSNLRSQEAISRCDLAVLVISAPEGILSQDRKIAGMIQEAGKACIVAVNKCDLVDFQPKKVAQFQEYLKKELDFLSYAQTVFISAKTGLNLKQLPFLFHEVLNDYRRHFSTSLLNRTLEEIIAENPPPQSKGRPYRIYYLTQKGHSPPVFLLFVNREEKLHFSYERYLKNQFLQKLGLKGTPLFFEFRPKRGRVAGKKP